MAKEKAPKPAPLYLRIEPKRDAYVWQQEINALVAADGASRVILYNGSNRSMQMRGGGWLKPINGFHPAHVESEEAFRGFLEECLTHGVRMPSSYSDVFMRMFRPPRLPWSVNAQFVEHFAGPWEEAKERGLLPGFWRQYDLNRAYKWASAQGLPDTDSFEKTDRLSAKLPGVYVARIANAYDGCPHPYNRDGWVMVSDEEIDAYNLTIAEVSGGVCWRRTLDPGVCVSVMERLSFGELVAKTFWGLWAARNPVQTYYPAKDKIVVGRSVFLNLPWAHFIVSKIKLRVHEVSGNACHVFCDSIITRDALPTSDDVGAWKLVQEFPEGVYVEGAGRYGYNMKELIKHSGTKRTA